MSSILSGQVFKDTAEALAEVVRFLAARGWTPATSSNFSTRIPSVDEGFAISKSGRDKYAFSADDVMLVDFEGKTLAPEGARPSAETLLHVEAYEDSAVGAVLHTHSVNATVLSMQRRDELVLEGFELLKGIAGHTTHETRIVLPIFPNTQDIAVLADSVRAYRREHGEIHGYLIAGHGLYAWGSDLAEARRHIETYEFLFECIFKMNGGS